MDQQRFGRYISLIEDKLTELEAENADLKTQVTKLKAKLNGDQPPPKRGRPAGATAVVPAGDVDITAEVEGATAEA
jgi:hypothetical protein